MKIAKKGKKEKFTNFKRMERPSFFCMREVSYEFYKRMDEIWTNNIYLVYIEFLDKEAGKTGPLHVWVRTIDNQPRRNWRHLQRIKSDLCGPEREGVELFPAESRLIDAGLWYHIWVLPEGESYSQFSIANKDGI